jgi:hypothetical protein
MADLLSWIVTHSVALGVGIVVGAGSLGGAQLAWNRVRKGHWFKPSADSDTAK